MLLRLRSFWLADEYWCILSVTDAWWVVTLLCMFNGATYIMRNQPLTHTLYCYMRWVERLHSKWMCCRIDSHTWVSRLSGTEGAPPCASWEGLHDSELAFGCRFNTSTTPSFACGSLCSAFFFFYFFKLISPSFFSPPPPITIFASQCICVRVRAYDIYLVD